MLPSGTGKSNIHLHRESAKAVRDLFGAEQVHAFPSGRHLWCWPATLTGLAAEIDVIDDSVFRLMVEDMPHIVWLATSDGDIEYLNRRGRAYHYNRRT